MTDPKPSPRHLSVVAQPHEARQLKLAAALEDMSLSAWLLSVGLKRADQVLAKYTDDPYTALGKEAA